MESINSIKEKIETQGFAIVPKAFDKDWTELARQRLYLARDQIYAEVGQDRLRAANELGVLRLICKFDDFFLKILEAEVIKCLVDALLGPTSIMHLQNGFILPPIPGSIDKIFQLQFHRDFPRILGGHRCSLNIMVAVDEFTAENGGTIIVPGTHQKNEFPKLEDLKKRSRPVECPEGSLIIFDSTLIHCAGQNKSEKDRLAINHQFTASYFKQQLDYVRALGEQKLRALPERTKQLLGWYTRVPTSLDEFYRPEAERLYRRGQG